MKNMCRILIVEDDPAIARIEKDYLEINKFEVDIAGDGFVAKNMVRDYSYDLILLDLMLPGMDGFELCRMFREDLDIPILIISARIEDSDKIRGLGLGADDYITKPFSPGELIARVRSNLAQYERLAGKIEQNRCHIGCLQIDTKARRVLKRGQEIALKNKEYDLLLFMVQNADMVFSREVLYEKVWGFDAVGDSSTVSVHIRRLREKLEDDPANPQLIETVWGAGYRLRKQV
ncbi:MAG: response regulator transcription factor [Lachnospiraceae bacterium]